MKREKNEVWKNGEMFVLVSTAFLHFLSNFLSKLSPSFLCQGTKEVQQRDLGERARKRDSGEGKNWSKKSERRREGGKERRRGEREKRVEREWRGKRERAREGQRDSERK